ncbi:hypothetical protein GCM10010198_30400 [Nocardia seriolae]|nr:hypothetical protein NSERKGN1266_11180 [Nocardia seriolae]BEK98993.1 hypothetical protein NSER024013_68990 [Nocardia seriolae]GEM25190.1 hypothetical protein NS2_34290 [Nocardia seriolae NBRC 15557]
MAEIVVPAVSAWAGVPGIANSAPVDATAAVNARVRQPANRMNPPSGFPDRIASHIRGTSLAIWTTDQYENTMAISYPDARAPPIDGL